MTAAIVWSILILVGSGLYLAGEVHGRRSVWQRQRRKHRQIAEQACEEVSFLGLLDEDALADNDRWSRKVRHFEVDR